MRFNCASRLETRQCIALQTLTDPHTTDGLEYFYGGGIQREHPATIAATFGMRPVQVVDLGETTKTKREFDAFVRSVSDRFTPATYDLFHNNCNNFTDAAANFLVGTGIPRHIIDLPNEFLQTPLGQMLAPMITSMQTSMYERMGAGDPLGGGLMGGGGTPTTAAMPDLSSFASMLGGGGATGTPAAATAPAAASAVAPPAPPAGSTGAAGGSGGASGGEPAEVAATAPSAVLDKKAKPLLSSDATVTPVIERLVSAGVATGDDADLLRRVLPQLGQKRFVVPRDDAEWHRALDIVSSATDGANAFAALNLLRVVVLRSGGVEALQAGTERCASALKRVVSAVAEGTIPSPAALLMAFAVTANLFAQKGGRKYALQAEIAGLALAGGLKELTGAKSNLRQMAAALLHNFALYLPVPSDDDAELDEKLVSLVCAMGEGLEAESDEETQRRRLLALGRIAQRCPAAVALLVSLGVDETLADLSKSPRAPDKVRALAAEVGAKIVG